MTFICHLSYLSTIDNLKWCDLQPENTPNRTGLNIPFINFLVRVIWKKDWTKKVFIYTKMESRSFFACSPTVPYLGAKCCVYFMSFLASLQPSITPSCKYSYIHNDAGLVTKITRWLTVHKTFWKGNVIHCFAIGYPNFRTPKNEKASNARKNTDMLATQGVEVTMKCLVSF